MVLTFSIDGEYSNELTTLLYEYFKSKNYKVRLCRRPDHKPIHTIHRHYNLLNHEKALLNAFDHSLTYYMEDWSKYDIVIWKNSKLHDYITLNDENTSLHWLSQINKYIPEMDTYYLINTDLNINIKKQLNIVEIKENDINKIYEQLLDHLHTFNTKCQWCNHIFKKDKYHLKYCSKTCSNLADRKQTLDRVNRYNRRYRDVKSPHEKNGLGSNALLKQHANPDFDKEHQLIINEKRRQGIL